MHVLITGANGFIGRHLAARILASPTAPSRLTLLDLQHDPLPELAPSSLVDAPHLHRITGSFADPAVLDSALSLEVDQVFHLAALPSGSTEKDPVLGYEINVGGTQLLLERLRAQEKTASLVFSSSIAVYGRPSAERVSDDTPVSPNLSYGAHKVMGEALVNDYIRRGWIQGCSVRVPGIVARPPEPNGAVSIFFSDLIRELAAGRPVTCPVSQSASSWLMSIGCVVDNLLHAASLRSDLNRSWCLPALHVQMGALVQAVAAHSRNPEVPALVNWAPDAWVEHNFGAYPPLECPEAEKAGFRPDASLSELVASALQLTRPDRAPVS